MGHFESNMGQNMGFMGNTGKYGKYMLSGQPVLTIKVEKCIKL